MNFVLLTKSTGLIGFIASILGIIMNGIFSVIDFIGIPNIGLAIILFTIVVNLLMLPLTIKQQKFSKLSAKMNPEIQAIQAKYKNKRDQDSMMAQNQEIQAVYAKYGVSQSGSCVQMLIQLPILFALYRVIYAIPAYVTKVGETFGKLAEEIIKKDNAEFILNSGIDTITNTVKAYGKSITDAFVDGKVVDPVKMKNGVIDVLNKLSSEDLDIIASAEHYDLTNVVNDMGQTILGSDGLIATYNNFLGLNIGDSPLAIIRSNPSVIIIIGAILIPLLSALTQWINTKLMPQPQKSGNDQADSMMQSMKFMNTFMPIMSAWLCFTFPTGMGLYWIAGNIVRGIQQVAINKHFDKMDFDEIIKNNSVKSAKKLEKMKEAQERMNAYANMKTRNIQSKANISSVSYNDNSDNQSESSQNSTPAKAGSMMAKANMVKEYNERKNK